MDRDRSKNIGQPDSGKVWEGGDTCVFNKIKGAGRGAARGLEDWLSELARRRLCRGLLSLLDAIRSLVKERGGGGEKKRK